MANGALQSGRGHNASTRVIVVIGSLIIAALVGVIIALVMTMNRSQQTVVEPNLPEQRGYVVNEDNVEDVVRDLVNAEPVAPGYYEARMSTTWTFRDGLSASSDAYVENVPNNTNDIYFDLEMRDTGEVLYASPVIPLGSYLNNITLDTALDAGTYDCVVVYHLIDENQNTLSTLNMGITVIVEN